MTIEQYIWLAAEKCGAEPKAVMSRDTWMPTDGMIFEILIDYLFSLNDAIAYCDRYLIIECKDSYIF